MTGALLRWPALLFAAGTLAITVSGCVVGDGGYGYDGGAYGADYYEPAGAVYGGWGADYQVGPFHDDHHPRGGFDRGGAHAYRAAPASHATPSIPSRGRSGGGRDDRR